MKNGDAVPLESFKAGVRARGYATGSWIGTPWQVMTWGMRQLGLGGGAVGEDRLAVGTWVLTGNVDVRLHHPQRLPRAKSVQECARNVLKVVADRERVDRIFSREMFQTEFAKSLNDECALTNSDFEVLITYLARDKKVVAYDGQVRWHSVDEIHEHTTHVEIDNQIQISWRQDRFHRRSGHDHCKSQDTHCRTQLPNIQSHDPYRPTLPHRPNNLGQEESRRCSRSIAVKEASRIGSQQPRRHARTVGKRL